MQSPIPSSEADMLPAPSLERADSKPMLLPAFEPSAPSSPALPRPSKRKYEGSPKQYGRALKRDYITPVPTSQTDFAPYSPPLLATARPTFGRSVSSASERVPLGAVPSIEIPINGEPVFMGRSSNSSHFQLSANRLISRIHIRAAYSLPDDTHLNGQIIVECMGWNGAKVHCRGKVFELGKGDSFTSDKPHADMLVDVQDARVLVRWPPIQARPASPTRWSDDDTPRRPVTPTAFASSPPPLQLRSPVSPSPRERPAFNAAMTFIGLPPSSSPVRIFEDIDDVEEGVDETVVGLPAEPLSPLNHIDTRPATPVLLTSQKTPPFSDVDEFSDRDEENDPIVDAFGPTGANLLARMAATSTISPERRRLPLKTSTTPQQNKSPIRQKITKSPIRNHVINQLAYSRLQSIPLSSILKNLPNALKELESPSKTAGDATRELTDGELKTLLDEIPCVGEIVREGKDAAGKPLEDEFYYIPEMDTDEMRRSVVENSLGKHTIRATRKQHKQYYWKKPRV